MRQAFLPHNYDQTMYNPLQNLKQENRSVDDYAKQWIQLVSRFIGGLRSQLQNVLAQFDPTTIAEAHHRAASFKTQLSSSTWTGTSNRFSTLEQAPSPTTRSSHGNDDTSGSASRNMQPTEEQTLRRCTSTNALWCYTCGKPGHRQTPCPNQQRRGLLLDEPHEDKDAVYYFEAGDDAMGHNIQTICGDEGSLLAVHQTCLVPPSREDQWLRTNIFRSTCTIKRKVCSFIIDSGSSRNVI